MIDVAIVGGGLCGLALAHSLQARRVGWTLLEARERLGGRVLTQTASNGLPVDLGATWYWPATQPSMTRLVQDLGLASFGQPDDGAVLLLDDPKRTPRVVQTPPGGVHGGARRLAGGMGALVDALAKRLPTARLRLRTEVSRLVDCGDHVELHASQGDRADVLKARQVVLALPPRVAQALVCFEPPLPADVMAAMRATPTWMATAAKAAVAYPRAFWREQGLTANAWVTHPQAVLAEVFDAGPPGGEVAALAGFVALDAAGRRSFERGLPMLIESQLAMLFGAEAQGGELHHQDWADERHSCSPLDPADLGGVTAGAPGEATLESALWQGRLLLGGSETARMSAGYLEGALGAAARLRRQIAEGVAARREAAALSPP